MKYIDSWFSLSITQNFSQHFCVDALLVKGSVFPLKPFLLQQNDSFSKIQKLGGKKIQVANFMQNSGSFQLLNLVHRGMYMMGQKSGSQHEIPVFVFIKNKLRISKEGGVKQQKRKREKQFKIFSALDISKKKKNQP